MKTTTRTVKGLVTFFVLVVLTFLGYNNYRNLAMEKLYVEAIGDPEYFPGTVGASSAVARLGTYRGQRATNLLIEIANNNGASLAPDSRVEAIGLLANRNSSDASVAIAKLLQPHEGLDVRRAAAVALNKMTCQGECIRSVLHYLGRIKSGDPNYEDLLIHPQGVESSQQDLKKLQDELYDNLYAVLRSQAPETISVLAQEYGLGTIAPSLFALDLVSRLRLRQACPYLLQSDGDVSNIPPQLYKFPRQEVKSLIESPNCK